ncbi:hypothetical protein EV382_0993 [Micromonospora violae]|uniref:Tetratricopeptide repeat protein n=1 Tax=Micromonospora violae TaxID=1278207 RepID=A0A4Q7UC94_9ACTN|nr:hypothetical protein [Micromonospora violae]RZT77828.1 hypothetical protein EV382_0993 [Micromonospora violae]
MTGDELTVLVDRLRWDRRRDPYRGRREYSQTARQVAEECDRLVGEGRADLAVPVLRKAVDRITRALMYLDDSSGIIGDDLQELMDLYAKACVAAPPNPLTLAGWLVRLECDGPGWPRVRLADFGPALGKRGIAEVERLVTERARVADPESWTGAFAVRDLREQLAEVSGDVDRYVAVLAEHLASAVQYQRIAEALRAAGRRDEAVDWARRGVAASAGSPYTDRLRDILVDMLVGAGDTPGAVRVRREEFARHPTAAGYRSLIDAVETAGGDDPTTWALGVLRERITQQPAYASELVDVLLTVGRDDQAWQEAQRHRRWLGGPQWQTLLQRRAVTHPEEVIQPYRDLVEQAILDSADRRRYRRAIALLPALRAAYQATGEHAVFGKYLAELRVEHKRRPTFLKTLDAAGL